MADVEPKYCGNSVKTSRHYDEFTLCHHEAEYWGVYWGPYLSDSTRYETNLCETCAKVKLNANNLIELKRL